MCWPAARMKKYNKCIVFLNEKLEFISPSEMECPEMVFYYLLGFSSLIACYLVRLGEQFLWVLSKYLSKRWLSPPREIVPYAYVQAETHSHTTSLVFVYPKLLCFRPGPKGELFEFLQRFFTALKLLIQQREGI